MSDRPKRRGAVVLSSFVDAITGGEAVDLILHWGRNRESRYVCAANVHSVVTARTDVGLNRALSGADLNVPDGAPVAWSLRQQGFREQRRVAGPDLVEMLCSKASRTSIGFYLYGSTEETLRDLEGRLVERFPGLRIVGRNSPPFRVLSTEEDKVAIERINSSGAHIVLVGLGCPKQELWMAAHKGRIAAVMLGVGAAFDFHAGAKSRAPRWLQSLGLEWLYRLGQEPLRLWRRYLVTNILFMILTAKRFIFSQKERS